MILKACELRRGDIVYDNKYKQKWFVKHVGEFITLTDMDPPIETDEAPVYFHTIWRMIPTSDVLFMEARDEV